MELRQLRYFLAVAEEGRFNRAASRLHIAAPSLSQQIKALENDLRVALFVRSNQQVKLTPAGQALLQRARVIVAEAEQARADVRAADAARQVVTLRIAHMADQVLEHAFDGSALGDLGLQLSVSSSRGDDALESVRHGRADVAVVWSRGRDERDLDGKVLCSVPFGVALPSGHPAIGAGNVPVGSLANEVLIMFPREPFDGIWDQIVDHFFPAGAGPDQVVVEANLLNAPAAVLRAVAAGTGIAPGIVGLAETTRMSGIELRTLDPALWLDLEAVWRAPARPPVRQLIEILSASALDSGIAVAAPRILPGDAALPHR